MPLDPSAPITPLQSGTIRALIRGAIASALALALRLSGHVVDDGFVRDVSNSGADLLLQLYGLWCYWKAAKGRINATETIKKG